MAGLPSWVARPTEKVARQRDSPGLGGNHVIAPKSASRTAMIPPGFVTRWNSWSTTCGSATWCRTWWQKTTSKVSSAKGSWWMSACWNGMSSCLSEASSVASATASADWSTPVTCAGVPPRWEMCSARFVVRSPCPQPASSSCVLALRWGIRNSGTSSGAGKACGSGADCAGVVGFWASGFMASC